MWLILSGVAAQQRNVTCKKQFTHSSRVGCILRVAMERSEEQHVRWKRILVDVIGFASMVPFFKLYYYLERTYNGYIAVIVPFIAYLPVAAIWHWYYAKYHQPD